MIRNLLTLLVGSVLFQSCMESDPPIVFTDNATLLVDTVYTTASVPDAQDVAIVVEDLTGVRCSSCPKAAKAAKTIKEQYGERVVVIGNYPTEPKNLTTPVSGYEDLRTDQAQLIATNVYGFSNQLPGGGVNRKVFDGQTRINTNFNTWGNAASQLVSLKSVVNIDVEKKQTSDSTFEIKGVFSFTGTPSFDPFVSVFLLEDGIKHPQTIEDGSQDKEYSHKHVVREMYTPYNGTPLLKAIDPSAERGVVVEKSWAVTIPSNVNVSNASLVIMVNQNDASNKEVLQCKEVKL